MKLVTRLAAAAGPALLTLYLAFNGGGFFAGAPAVVAIVLGVALVLRITIASEPFAGFGPWLVAATAGLGAYAVWNLLSALWSDAPAQAMIEFDRVLMYWLALVLFGSLPWDRRTLLWAIRALAAAMVLVAAVALTTHLAPDVWAAPATMIDKGRVAFPLTYWNALGVFVAVTTILCFSLAARREEPPLSKALASAALPVLAATLYFTFSRGAIAAVVVGLVAFALLARSRGLLSAALATIPPTAVTVLVCYQSDVLSTVHYASPAGLAEGHDVAPLILACAAVAALARLLLLRFLDPWLGRIPPQPRVGRRPGIAAVAILAVALIAVGVAFGAPGRIGDQYDHFVHNTIKESGNPRGRLTSFSNNGRLELWRVSLDEFSAHPLDGSGAGTYARNWARNSRESYKVEDGHSLYFEVLGELGATGLVLLGIGLVGLLGGLASRIRGPDRIVYAALLAAGIAWAAHAAVDWDWEMPATVFWLFAVGGMAISRPPGRPLLPAPGRLGRVALGIGCLFLIVTPALMALSQGRLNDSVQALKNGDCRTAADDALAAVRFVSARPEPYQVLGFCDSRAGRHQLAVTMLRTAVARDPGVWDSYYGLSLVQAAAGEDPRPAARRAFELAPHESLARDAVRRFHTNDPRKWRRRALSARLPVY